MLMKLAGVDFAKLFLPSKKSPGAKKIHCSISLTIKAPNLMLKLAHFLPNAVRSLPNLDAKKCFSSCFLEKVAQVC